MDKIREYVRKTLLDQAGSRIYHARQDLKCRIYQTRQDLKCRIYQARQDLRCRIY